VYVWGWEQGELQIGSQVQEMGSAKHIQRLVGDSRGEGEIKENGRPNLGGGKTEGD
jgi:hypothetical protein